jgi:hypothetical protein
MQKVRLFHNTEENIANLEKEINAWLAQSGATVVSIQGNIAPQTVVGHTEVSRISYAQEGSGRRFAPSDLFVIVLYTDART